MLVTMEPRMGARGQAVASDPYPSVVDLAICLFQHGHHALVPPCPLRLSGEFQLDESRDRRLLIRILLDMLGGIVRVDGPDSPVERLELSDEEPQGRKQIVHYGNNIGT